MRDQAADVLIVGAGLAGLTCARELVRAELTPLVIEAADCVGGRVRTDAVDGFLLDRGFQVLLTAYPTTRQVLDYDRLDLRPFEPGALVRVEGEFRRIVDPFRRPGAVLETLSAPVGTFGDKLRVARLALSLRRDSVEEILARDESTTRDRLQALGFSPKMIEVFFRPFLGGVFLDADLTTSSRMFEFVFKMFGAGPVAVPAAGMGAISGQLAGDLRSGSIRTGAPVASVTRDSVTLESGERLTGKAVVVATDGRTARRLANPGDIPPFRPALCWYFEAVEPPVEEGILILDGDGHGPVTNLAVMSQVADTYAPSGRQLISATVLGASRPSTELLGGIRSQMRKWFGVQVDGWREIEFYDIDAALPDQSPGQGGVCARPTRTEDGLHVCGDHRVHGSIEGAIQSGLLAAEQVIERLAHGLD
jgi:phytoene dehydrogenase-like protein